MKKCVVTGAAGFTGISLVENLLAADCFVYAVVRPDSPHNNRLQSLANVTLVDCDRRDFAKLSEKISEPCQLFYHLAWQGNRYDFAGQYENIVDTLSAVQAAADLGCQRFIGIGSQAEYGPCQDVISENTCPNPTDAYGAAKLAACALSKQKAQSLKLEWVWGRIFSLYGTYEPTSRMLPALLATLRAGKDFSLATDGYQNWDYLHVRDGANAIRHIGEAGRNGEIYNIAHGDYKTLREYVTLAQQVIGTSAQVIYADGVKADFSLQPSVAKIKQDTNWRPEIDFATGINF